MDLDFLTVDNFDFTRKMLKKIWVKTREKNVGGLSKFDFSNSVVFEALEGPS